MRLTGAVSEHRNHDLPQNFEASAKPEIENSGSIQCSRLLYGEKAIYIKKVSSVFLGVDRS